MPEVYSSAEVSLELLDPITGAVLMTIPFLRDDTFSESPTYAPRGYHRSAAVSAARLRSKGTITIRKDVEGLAFAQEVERWQKGIVWYPMGSDLKGKRFRHPHVRKVMMQPDGTKEYRTGYDVRLSDRSLSRPDAGLLSESLTFDVQGGFDTPGSDRGEPVRALDFHRTGSATYIAPDGQLKTAGDGVARFGVPWVVRRNLLLDSGNYRTNYVAFSGASISGDILTASGMDAGIYREISISGGTAGRTYTLSWIVSGSGKAYVQINGRGGATADEFAAGLPVTLTGEPQRISVPITLTQNDRNSLRVYLRNGQAGALSCKMEGTQIDLGALTPYQPTNSTGPDLTHPLNGAGLVLEGFGVNLLTYSEQFDNPAWQTDSTGLVVTVNAAAAPMSPAISAADKLTFGTDDYIYQKYTGNTRSVTLATSTPITMTSEWQRFSITQDFGAGTGIFTFSVWLKAGTMSKVNLRLYASSTGVVAQISNAAVDGNPALPAGDCYVWGAQLEKTPFSTSYMPSGIGFGVRESDLVGIVPPHNLLKWSEDFTKWQKTVGITVSGGTITKTAGAPSEGIYQQITTDADGYFCGAIKLKAGSLSKATLRIYDYTVNADIAPAQVLDLPAADYSTFAVRGYAGNGRLIGFIIYPGDSSQSTTGAIQVAQARLVKGHHPGIYVPTTDTPILPPPSPALDPAWQQNGRARFRVMPPPISTGKHYNLIGYPSRDASVLAPMRLFRNAGFTTTQQTINYVRQHNAATGFGGNAGLGILEGTVANFYDGTPHDVILEWTNEVRETDGRREMWQRLYIDGVLVAQQDVAALYGAMAWAEIDPSRLISDGTAFAVLSMLPSRGGVIVEFAPRRAGYRQVDRAA